MTLNEILFISPKQAWLLENDINVFAMRHIWIIFTLAFPFNALDHVENPKDDPYFNICKGRIEDPNKFCVCK